LSDYFSTTSKVHTQLTLDVNCNNMVQNAPNLIYLCLMPSFIIVHLQIFREQTYQQYYRYHNWTWSPLYTSTACKTFISTSSKKSFF